MATVSKTERVVHDTPLECADAAAWAHWLARHHATAAGVWLRMAKKASGIASVDYAGALEEALCHGWIDGQRKSDDAQYFQQRFTPRTARSMWSQINRAKVLKLIEEGRMRRPGWPRSNARKPTGAGTRPTKPRAWRPCRPTCRPRWTPTRRPRSSS